MQFVVGLLEATVWPIVAVFCILTLKKPLSSLILLAQKLKFKDFEMEFGQELKVATIKAEGAFPELKEDKKSTLIASVENLPNASILEAWGEVDEAAESLLRTKLKDVNLDIDTRYKLIEDLLIDNELLDTKKAKLFSELRQLRNKVAHAKAFEVGKAEAVQYIELCFKLVEYFDQFERKSA